VVSRRKQIENGSVFSVRQAAAACNVSPPVVRRRLSLGLLSAPPWTVEQLRSVRDVIDPQRHRLGSSAAHGTMARWNSGCSCARCPQMQNNAARARGRRKAQERLPSEVRQRLLDAIYTGQPFRRVIGRNELPLLLNDSTSRYSREVSRPTAARRRRRRLALAMAAVAIGLVVLEPFPKGEVLLSLTDTHGVDTGDVPAIAMLLVAACLAIR
jgi:hypothetical protein